MSLDAISNPDYDTTPLKPQVGSFQDVASCDKPNSAETMEDWNNLLEETRKKVEWLREKVLTEEQKEVLRNIYCNLPQKQVYAEWEQLNSHDSLRQAIEKQTMQLFDIPWENKIAISVYGNNLDFLYNSDWTEYFDFLWRRSDKIKYSAFMWIMWIEETSVNWDLYIIAEGQEYKVLTEEYFKVMLEKVQEFNEIWKFLYKVFLEMEKRWL